MVRTVKTFGDIINRLTCDSARQTKRNEAERQMEIDFFLFSPLCRRHRFIVRRSRRHRRLPSTII